MGTVSTRSTIEVGRMRLDALSEYDCDVMSAFDGHVKPTLFARPVRQGRGGAVLSPRSARAVHLDDGLAEIDPEGTRFVEQ